MSGPTRIALNSVLVGDELGQIKLVQLSPNSSLGYQKESNDEFEHRNRFSTHGTVHPEHSHRHRIVRVLDKCFQQGPAASRAITNIRPIESVYEPLLDTTAKPNNLYLITNKVGQMFVCNTDSIRSRLKCVSDYQVKLSASSHEDDEDIRNSESSTPMLSPVYYDMNKDVPVVGGQSINQTNVLVIYQNGDIQHVSVGQDILQASMKIRRKAIRLLGMGYNSDAKAMHWRIDGSSGLCYFDSDVSATHINENDPLTDIVLSSPTHKLNKRHVVRSTNELYNKSPCIKARRHNEQERLVPTQVIDMVTSRAEQYKPSSKIFKWDSITSLNLIYKKLALYDLVGTDDVERPRLPAAYSVNCYKLNDSRLALGGNGYHLRVYDVQAQKPMYNSKTGAAKNPLSCPASGEVAFISDIDWLGGNKTTKKNPNMLAACSGFDSIVNVYDLRSARPVFHINLTDLTDDNWQPYEDCPRGCMFTSLCASGAPYSTAVPSQQLVLGSTNGQLHIVDMRFVTKSHRVLGKLSGFCGGSYRDLQFVSESFETSKMVSCASDRFVRVHKILTSYTSVISQKLATKVFMGTKPTCIQPVCDEVTQSYLASVLSRCGSESHISTVGSRSRSLL